LDDQSELEQAAQLSKSGIFSGVKSPIRSIVTDQDSSFDAQGLLTKLRGKTQTGIVEYVINASSMRVLLLPSNQNPTYCNVLVKYVFDTDD
jgi:hypothetical protein